MRTPSNWDIRNRTGDLLCIRQVLYQLRYIPLTAIRRLALVFIVPCVTLCGYLRVISFYRQHTRILTSFLTFHKESSFRLPFRELVSAQVLYDFETKMRMVRLPILSSSA